MPEMPDFSTPLRKSTPGGRSNMPAPQGFSPEGAIMSAPYMSPGDAAGWDPIARPPSCGKGSTTLK
eukprot:8460989-Prorocentrum_lima.AAC.1